MNLKSGLLLNTILKYLPQSYVCKFLKLKLDKIESNFLRSSNSKYYK